MARFFPDLDHYVTGKDPPPPKQAIRELAVSCLEQSEGRSQFYVMAAQNVPFIC